MQDEIDLVHAIPAYFIYIRSMSSLQLAVERLNGAVPLRRVQGWTRKLTVVGVNQVSNIHVNMLNSVARPSASLHGFIRHVCLMRNR